MPLYRRFQAVQVCVYLPVSLFPYRTCTHEDLGQLQMYVNYFDRYEKLPDESPTVGILLCADKNDTLVKITLPEDNTNILASKYQLYLPSEKALLEEIKDIINIAEPEGGGQD